MYICSEYQSSVPGRKPGGASSTPVSGQQNQMVEVSVAHTPVTVQVWLFTRSTRGTVQEKNNIFDIFFTFLMKVLNFFESYLYLIMKNALFSMMQFTHKSYRPTDSVKGLGKVVASIENWARELGTWRVEEETIRRR